MTLAYRFETTAHPVVRARLKLEINTREHDAVLERRAVRLEMENPWHSAGAPIGTYRIEEILATKLRALYQRKKGRDLFDLDRALQVLAVDPGAVVGCFQAYMERGGTPVSRAELERNLHAKLRSPGFRSDIVSLLAPGVDHDPDRAWERVHLSLVRRLRGQPWRGDRA